MAELDGERVLLTHGDALCTDDHSYQELRSIVRTPDWQRRFLALPLADRELLAESGARRQPRAHTSRTIPEHHGCQSRRRSSTAYRATRVRRMIHGHTHRPGIHDTSIEGEPAQRIVLGAWYEQGSYIQYENGRYELRSLPR